MMMQAIIRNGDVTNSEVKYSTLIGFSVLISYEVHTAAC